MPPPENKWLVTPQPLRPPTIRPKLETLDPLSRATECFRHLVLSTEFWLSPNGRLRWWIKLNLLLAAWLVIPAVVLLPVVGFFLHEADGVLSVLLSIVRRAMLLAVLVTVATLARKHFPSSSPRSPGRRR